MLTIHVCVSDGIFLADDVYRDERGRREEGGRLLRQWGWAGEWRVQQDDMNHHLGRLNICVFQSRSFTSHFDQ